MNTKLLFIAALATAVGGCSVTPAKAPTTMTNPGGTETTTGSATAANPGTGIATVPAKEVKETTLSRIVCKSTKEERVLEMRSKDEGCELLYTRGGNTRSIATSRIGDGPCEAVRGKTQSNLERSGYRCER